MNGSVETTNVSGATTVVASNSRPRPELQLSPAQRWISLAEFVVGSAIVIGHNVYHVVPNEVPILFVLGLLSFRLRDGSWWAMGLRWPASWRRTVLFALAAAALRILLGTAVIEPLTAHFWPPAAARVATTKSPVIGCRRWSGLCLSGHSPLSEKRSDTADICWIALPRRPDDQN